MDINAVYIRASCYWFDLYICVISIPCVTCMPSGISFGARLCKLQLTHGSAILKNGCFAH